MSVCVCLCMFLYEEEVNEQTTQELRCCVRSINVSALT